MLDTPNLTSGRQPRKLRHFFVYLKCYGKFHGWYIGRPLEVSSCGFQAIFLKQGY